MRLLANLLRSLPERDRSVAVDYLSGSTPQGKLGVGWKQLEGLAPNQQSDAQPLTILEVDDALTEVAGMSGSGSRTRKRDRLAALFGRASRREVTFLRGLLTGTLRTGSGRGLMLEAVAEVTETPADQVRRAYTRSGKTNPDPARDSAVELFRPLAPMLAGTAKDVQDALARTAPAVAEAKADGARVQVHRREGEVRVYSRTGKDVTESVPEVIDAVLPLPGGDLILDGEALVWMEDRPASFQVTMRRFGGRAPSAAALRRLPVRVFFFDLLMRDGEELLDQPLRVRRGRLLDLAPEATLLPSTGELLDDGAAAVEALLAQAHGQGFEGVIVKALDSRYEAGRRGSGWAKLKPVYTLDLVVLAAEWGSGRRRGWLSNLHLGARDEATGEFVMLGKTFKGLTDAVLTWQTEELQRLETHRTRSTVWVRPERVVEIAFDGIQQSPRYPGGLTLRFARVKGYRPDKTPGEADTMQTVRALYDAQASTVTAPPPEQRDLFES